MDNSTNNTQQNNKSSFIFPENPYLSPTIQVEVEVIAEDLSLSLAHHPIINLNINSASELIAQEVLNGCQNNSIPLGNACNSVRSIECTAGEKSSGNIFNKVGSVRVIPNPSNLSTVHIVTGSHFNIEVVEKNQEFPQGTLYLVPTSDCCVKIDRIEGKMKIDLGHVPLRYIFEHPESLTLGKNFDTLEFAIEALFNVMFGGIEEPHIILSFSGDLPPEILYSD